MPVLSRDLTDDEICRNLLTYEHLTTCLTINLR